MRGKILVRKLAAGNAVWVVHVGVAPSHRKRIRWGTLRVATGYRFGAGHVLEKCHLENEAGNRWFPEGSRPGQAENSTPRTAAHIRALRSDEEVEESLGPVMRIMTDRPSRFVRTHASLAGRLPAVPMSPSAPRRVRPRRCLSSASPCPCPCRVGLVAATRLGKTLLLCTG